MPARRLKRVIEKSKIRRKTVELAPGAPRPSRIRREPPPPPKVVKAVNPYPSEREAWMVMIGVVLFALAIAIVIFRISDITSH